MRKLASIMVVVGITVYGAMGCAIVASPVAGVFFTDAKYGFTATTSTAASKEGRACATSILGWVGTGDASVAAAKANGGITEVSSVDHTAKSVLGIFGEWCTIVRGK